MAFKYTTNSWRTTKYLVFKDCGLISPGAVTKKFLVTNRINGVVLGIVKWLVLWRKYVFFPDNCILDAECLDEISKFCYDETIAHKLKRKEEKQNAGK